MEFHIPFLNIHDSCRSVHSVCGEGCHSLLDRYFMALQVRKELDFVLKNKILIHEHQNIPSFNWNEVVVSLRETSFTTPATAALPCFIIMLEIKPDSRK